MNISNDYLNSVMEDLEACDNGEYSYGVLSLSIARKIVESEDISFLKRLPDRLSKEVLEIARIYRDEGEFWTHSSVSSCDHTELARNLYLLSVDGGYLV